MLEDLECDDSSLPSFSKYLRKCQFTGIVVTSILDSSVLVSYVSDKKYFGSDFDQNAFQKFLRKLFFSRVFCHVDAILCTICIKILKYLYMCLRSCVWIKYCPKDVHFGIYIFMSIYIIYFCECQIVTLTKYSKYIYWYMYYFVSLTIWRNLLCERICMSIIFSIYYKDKNVSINLSI